LGLGSWTSATVIDFSSNKEDEEELEEEEEEEEEEKEEESCSNGRFRSIYFENQI
jgi:hypothetical protein